MTDKIYKVWSEYGNDSTLLLINAPNDDMARREYRVLTGREPIASQLSREG